MIRRQRIKVTVWKAKDGWRWNMKRSGCIIAESGEAYRLRSGLYKTLDAMLNAIVDGRLYFTVKP